MREREERVKPRVRPFSERMSGLERDENARATRFWGRRRPLRQGWSTCSSADRGIESGKCSTRWAKGGRCRSANFASFPRLFEYTKSSRTLASEGLRIGSSSTTNRSVVVGNITLLNRDSRSRDMRTKRPNADNETITNPFTERKVQLPSGPENRSLVLSTLMNIPLEPAFVAPASFKLAFATRKVGRSSLFRLSIVEAFVYDWRTREVSSDYGGRGESSGATYCKLAYKKSSRQTFQRKTWQESRKNELQRSRSCEPRRFEVSEIQTSLCLDGDSRNGTNSRQFGALRT